MLITTKTIKKQLHFLLPLLLLAFGCQNKAGNSSEEARLNLTGNEVIDGLSAKIMEKPENADLYYQRANAYYEAESYDEAIRDMKTAIGLDSTNIDYLHLLGDVYLDYFKSKEALDIMYRAAELYPRRIPTLLKLSEFQLILKRNRQSMKTIDNILKIDPQNPEAFFMLGMNLKETGDTVKAINAFQTAVENNPDLIDGWLMLGNLYDRLDNPLATRFFENALRVDSTNMEAWLGKATHLHRRGDLDEALEVYKEIIRKNPQFADAYYNIGLVYLEQEALDKAYQNFNIATEIAPTYAQAYYYKGLIREARGDKQAARENYKQALNIDPAYQYAREALNRVGDPE
jgi:tetratricopeptide (TPR) repeat protein